MTSSGTAPLGHRGLKFKWLDGVPHGVPWSLGTPWHLAHLSLLDGPKPEPPPFLPRQSSHPAGVLSRAWARLPFWTVPQKGTRDGGTSHQVMAQALWVSALLGLDQRFEPRIFMPGVVPGDVFHNTL